jgi:Arabinose efflux permease
MRASYAESEHDLDIVDPPAIRADGKHKVSTGSMLRLSLWVSFAAWIANFDNGYIGAVLIMPSYQRAFGTCTVLLNPMTNKPVDHCSLTPLQQSLCISLNFLFIGIGGGLSGISGRYTGRRGAIQIGCMLAIIGAAGMLGTGGRGAGSFAHYMICRCISAIGIGQLISASVTYGSECIDASKRGISLALYNVGLALGNVASGAVCAGSAELEPRNNWQWKTPILCQIPLGIILGAGILMFPESPRWILNNDDTREEEARRAFSILYRIPANSPEITAQIEDIKSHIKEERAAATSNSWFEIYKSSQIRRTSASALIMIGLSVTGIQFVQPYATTFLKGVGISNPYLINVIIGLCILAGSLIGPLVVEYGGRRFAILTGYISMAACMLVLSSVNTALGGDDQIAKMVVVILLCLWAFIFGGTIAPSAGLASVEMHSVALRTYGQANTVIFYGLFSFGATFWTPYMLDPNHGNMGPNVGYFYAGVTVIIAILVFLLVPETATLSLEQIDDLFYSGVRPWRTSRAGNQDLTRQIAREKDQEMAK